MEDEPAPDPARVGRTSGERGASGGAADLREAVVEALRTLPAQSKLVLLAVLACDARDEGTSTTGEVYNAYERLCADAPLDPLSQRRISDLLDELDTFGLIAADVVSRGRYGRTREIEGAIAPSPTCAVLLADGDLGELSRVSGLASDD